jgi:hypothetical protein
MTIDKVYPWGRSFDEYKRMFSLTPHDLTLRIIGCADGPASFNTEMHRRGHQIISCDPLYAFAADEIRSRVSATHETIIANARTNAHRFLWNTIRSPEELGRARMQAMETFAADFELGKTEGRYLNRSLPDLEFPKNSFDLALCSHFLFLYSEEFSLEFHIASVHEMCRVAKEARIFPLLDMQGNLSIHLKPLVNHFKQIGFIAEIEQVEYEFQRGGNQMLRICR